MKRLCLYIGSLSLKVLSQWPYLFSWRTWQLLGEVNASAISTHGYHTGESYCKPFVSVFFGCVYSWGRTPVSSKPKLYLIFTFNSLRTPSCFDLFSLGLAIAIRSLFWGGKLLCRFIGFIIKRSRLCLYTVVADISDSSVCVITAFVCFSPVYPVKCVFREMPFDLWHVDSCLACFVSSERLLLMCPLLGSKPLTLSHECFSPSKMWKIFLKYSSMCYFVDFLICGSCVFLASQKTAAWHIVLLPQIFPGRNHGLSVGISTAKYAVEVAKWYDCCSFASFPVGHSVTKVCVCRWEFKLLFATPGNVSYWPLAEHVTVLSIMQDTEQCVFLPLLARSMVASGRYGSIPVHWQVASISADSGVLLAAMNGEC